MAPVQQVVEVVPDELRVDGSLEKGGDHGSLSSKFHTSEALAHVMYLASLPLAEARYILTELCEPV